MKDIETTSGKLSLIHLIAYIIWPFGTLLLSLRKINRSSYIVFVIASVFLGFTYEYRDEADMSRYVEQFNELCTYSLSNFLSAYESGTHSDYYTLTMSLIVGLFTDNSRVYLAVILLIYSFFYVMSIRIVIEKNLPKSNILSSAFIFILFFYVSIFYINGLRFFTAFYVFFYSFIQIYFNKKNKYYMLALLTPLIHLAFAPLLGFLLFYLLFRKNRKICFLILMISFFVQPSIDFAKYTSNKAAIIKISGYTTVEGKNTLESSFAERHQYVSERYKAFRLINESHFYMLLIIFLFVFLNRQTRNYLDKNDETYLNVNLLLLSVVNLLIDFGEGYRYNYVFGFFLLITLFSITSSKFNFKSAKLRGVIWFFIIGIAIFELSHLYVSLQTISIEFLLSNWLFVLVSM